MKPISLHVAAIFGSRGINKHKTSYAHQCVTRITDSDGQVEWSTLSSHKLSRVKHVVLFSCFLFCFVFLIKD